MPAAPPRTGLLEAVERPALASGKPAFLARTSAAHAPGLVVLPDGRGLHAELEELAAAFGDAGVHTLAVEDPDDVRAAADELRRRGVRTVYVLGFGAGGRSAFLQGSQQGIDGVVGFYGPPPVDEARTGRLTAPVLALYAGADESIRDDDVEAFHAALAEAGTLQETVVYDGARRGFFDREPHDHPEACDDAWRRVLRFVGVPVLS